MKSLKTKVMASLAMLVVAAVMMTSSSFAWYTISTQGELSKVKVKMSATDTLEIAVAENEPGESNLGDAGNQQKWGSTAVYGSAAASISELTQVATIPDPTNTVKIELPEYDGTNRLKTQLVTATNSDGATYGETSATPLVWKDGNNNPCVYVYDFWVRSNKETTAKIHDENCSFGGGLGSSDASLLVKFVDLTTGSTNKDKVIAKWYSDSQGKHTTDVTINLQPGAANTDAEGYNIGHYAIYVYAEGDAIKGKHIDSDEDLPTFDGDFTIVKG